MQGTKLLYVLPRSLVNWVTVGFSRDSFSNIAASVLVGCQRLGRLAGGAVHDAQVVARQGQVVCEIGIDGIPEGQASNIARACSYKSATSGPGLS